MKNVIVSGGTRGLGLAIARRLQADGFHVFALGRSASEELRAHGQDPGLPGKLDFVACDLSSLKEIKPLVTGLYRQFGDIFGLVNNAAIGSDGVLSTMHDSQITELLNLNLASPILLTKYVSRYMLMGGEGRIVNIASIIAKTGFSGLSVYAASKAGLLGFSRSLARELGRAQITVTSVLPGYMQTDMTAGLDREKVATIERRSPLGRLATTDEVAAVVSFLLSPEARSITGSEYTVDAGSTA